MAVVLILILCPSPRVFKALLYQNRLLQNSVRSCENILMLTVFGLFLALPNRIWGSLIDAFHMHRYRFQLVFFFNLRGVIIATKTGPLFGTTYTRRSRREETLATCIVRGTPLCCARCYRYRCESATLIAQRRRCDACA